ncbi:MAG: peptidylprolyl isomerase [Chromatiales bacterium]|jgi:FKBP-type peptidyl-prolyl cis-trans isomerase 2|nr:peptidylprolyl isomerase [Chromatiales bacterium]MDP6149875.1 FKBP-type peptidyl-prolyl cis-trans isomerase [Gammaproteobacteria bacterium]HJP04317.1 FKBP-type peptidyl-prolyl cis-trans isomerase [Gammaproteobacteria bacterium]
MIEEGVEVCFTYTLTVEGEVLESNAGQEPLVYVQGDGQLLPALEAQLIGLSAGDTKTVNLDAANAYGEFSEAAFQEVPLDRIPEEARVVDATLQSQGFTGPIRVAEIKADVIVLDFNHPLAGKDLRFDITIVDIDVIQGEPESGS